MQCVLDLLESVMTVTPREWPFYLKHWRDTVHVWLLDGHASVWVHVCVGTHIRRYMNTCTCVCDCHSLGAIYAVFRAEAHWVGQGWLTNKPQVSSCLCLLSSGITSIHHHIWVFTWVLAWNSGPHVCMGSPSLIHLSLLSWIVLIKKDMTGCGTHH